MIVAGDRSSPSWPNWSSSRAVSREEEYLSNKRYTHNEVWIHQTRLAEGSGDTLTLHLELLRFKRMLDWIVYEVIALFHDGSQPYVDRPP